MTKEAVDTHTVTNEEKKTYRHSEINSLKKIIKLIDFGSESKQIRQISKSSIFQWTTLKQFKCTDNTTTSHSLGGAVIVTHYIFQKQYVTKSLSD